MGEYVWTTITIGGAATREVLDELEQITEDLEDGGTITPGSSVTVAGEFNFGNCAEIKSFCLRHGLAFNSSWAAQPGVFGSGIEYWHPGMVEPKEVDADDDGRPVVSLPELEQALALNGSLADLVAELKQASSDAVPPLVLADPKLPLEKADA